MERLPTILSDVRAMAPRSFRRLSSAHTRALMLTLASLVFWSLWNAERKFDHPWGDMSAGTFTDHLSHMNAARLFPRVGCDLWRVPIAQQFRVLTDEELQRMPFDVQRGGSHTGGVYYVPGWPANKPLVIGWTDKTRMYPPGDMVLVAPIAALYHYTDLSLRGACRLLIGWYIVLAHVALFFFFLTFFESRAGGIEWLAAFLVYSNVMRYTLEGFYDAAAIAPLVLCARYLARRRGLAAAVAYCVAAFLHFRAFFLGPWALFAAWLMVRTKFWKGLGWRGALAMAVAIIFGLSALHAFWLDWPSLERVPPFSPIFLGNHTEDPAMVWNVKLILLVCAAALLWARAWLDVAVLTWLAAIMFLLREFTAWHLVIPMAWVGAPARPSYVRAIRLAFLLTVVALVFGDRFSPSWMVRLFAPG
jgi:hypothetical protein